MKVMLRRVSETIVTAGQKYYVLYILSVCVCVCSLSCPACKGHALYYTALCGLSGSNIVFHMISKTAQFWKKKLNIKCVF
jgi:hypothetical protein